MRCYRRSIVAVVAVFELESTLIDSISSWRLPGRETTASVVVGVGLAVRIAVVAEDRQRGYLSGTMATETTTRSKEQQLPLDDS